MTPLERAQEASKDLFDIARKAKHDRGCPTTKIQTDEFRCTCTVGKKYRLVRQTLIDLSAPTPVEPNAFECMDDGCRMIGRCDPEDTKGDICPNCGEQSVRFVHIEVVR